MNTLTRPLGLTVTLALLLASCTRAISTEVPSPISTAPLSQLVMIELTVQADTSVPLNAVGQVINFKYNVRNAGSTSTPGPVTVTGAACPEINTVGNLDNTLDVNETVTCTGSYTITQADLDRGSVTNVATATVYGINSSPVTTSVPLARANTLTLTTSASPLTYDRLGQTITYTYVITNAGSAALGPAQFTISDDPVGPVIPCGDANTTLAPGASLTCTATFVIPELLDSIKNTATASGGASTSAPASTTITRSSSPPVNLVAGNTIQHTVSAGEWLWQIARCYGADPIRVRDANRRALVAGTIVTVPNIGSAGNIYGPPCVETYTVQSGDTWNSIALKFNADSAVLQRANPGALAVGRQIKIPRNSAAGVKTTGVPTGRIQVGDQDTIGGRAGTVLNIMVRFEASSPSGAVTEMRVKYGASGACLTAAEMADAVWEPFVAQRTYTYTPPINWSTFKLHVQYRDAQGNVSAVACDEVVVEGMP